MNEEIKQYLKDSLSVSLSIIFDKIEVTLYLEGEKISCDYDRFVIK